ncbi:MAG TPA: amino acid permease [Draconibacterium sp.]|nr:amino acid permease [Draconibacterium sp.]
MHRKLGLFSVTNIVIANIIGAGIFTTTGFLMDYLGNPLLMLLLWFIGGLIAFCGAIAFGELGATFPEAGGEYIFISKLYNPLLGFLSGWLSLIVGFSAPIAASAIGFSEYLSLAFPSLQATLLPSEIVNPLHFKKLLAITAILVFTFIHSRGVIFGTRIQNTLTILKVALITGLIVAGFTFGKGSFHHFETPDQFQFSFSGWKSIGLSLMFIMFAYSGWNSATYIGSEIKSPDKVIPRSLLISTGIVMILYLLLNVFFVYSISPGQIKGVPEIAGLAAGMAFSGFAESVISLFISFALISSLSAFIILGPRVYYSMTKEGYFFDFAAKVHPKYKVPVGAILLQSSIAIILVISGSFEQILVYMGFSLGIFPILAVWGVFKLRLSGKSALKLPGYPFVHIIFIVTGIAMLILAYFERPFESSIAILTALSGIPVFYGFKRNKKSRFV